MTGNAGKTKRLEYVIDGKSGSCALNLEQQFPSLAVMKFAIDDANSGIMQLRSLCEDFFPLEKVEFLEGFAQTMGLAIADRRAQWALRERVKELTCLYSISQIIQEPDITIKEMLQRIVEILPQAWQYPDIACARIALDAEVLSTPNCSDDIPKLTSGIIVRGKKRGSVEVGYFADRPALRLEVDVFLREEHYLIDTIARQIALVVERRHSEKERSELQEQLRHADRLATIGQLSAGVAHELNEPLAGILGFAQLAKKSRELPEQVGKDIERIVGAALHAREIVRKLLIFSRQIPTKKTSISLNDIIRDGLYFWESRCSKEGVELRYKLAPKLPRIYADPSQIQQVLVNLVVNAIQAMPKGGKLDVSTHADGEFVHLVVEDTGIGMSDEILKQIFIPFFTTKDVGQGTGLGLPVVHGIVTAHGGAIEVQSAEDKGSRFEVKLPVHYSKNEGNR